MVTLNNESKRNIVSWLPLTSKDSTDSTAVKEDSTAVKEDSTALKAILLIAHGLNEHSLRHSEMAHNYAKLGTLSDIFVVAAAAAAVAVVAEYKWC